MNRLFYLFCCSLLLIAGLAACSADGDDPPEQPDSHQDEVPVDSIINPIDDSGSSAEYEVISTVPVSEEVKAFFDEALPKEEDRIADFLFPNHITASYSYYLINSEAELREKYIGNKNLPTLDFDKYSVIIVKFPAISIPDYYYLEIHQYRDSSIILAFCMNASDWYYSGSFDTYNWGVFPKIKGEINGIENSNFAFGNLNRESQNSKTKYQN